MGTGGRLVGVARFDALICGAVTPCTRPTIGPEISVEFERVEALELLGMTLAHLNDAEARGDLSPRVALLMVIRDKLAHGLREDG